MKRFLLPLVIVFSLALIAVGGFIWWSQYSKPVSNNEQHTRYVIPKGRSAGQIGKTLYEEGLIKSPFVFKVYVQVFGKAKEIQAGEFTLSPNLALSEIVEKLTSGPEEIWVTIPEGLRREEISEKVVKSLELEGDEAKIFGEVFLKESEGREGFLFPDTYLFPRDVKPTLVVGKLIDTFDTKTKTLSEGISGSGYTLNQLITLASIVEREAKTEEERPFVAGILLNRIEAGIALQADATVQYALANSKLKTQNSKPDNYWIVLKKDDLSINSPYNTYTHTGFPPAPIANPGLSAIEAAVNPAESTYFYYIHDPEGQIHYAETLTQHNENVRRYLGK